MTDETKQQLSSILGSLLTYIVTHIKEFTLVYAVVGGAMYATWEYVFRQQIEAWAGEVSITAVTEALTADCENNPTKPGYNPDSLACQKENEIAAENAQTKAIQDLSRQFDSFKEQQSGVDLKRDQQMEQLIRLFEGLQPE